MAERLYKSFDEFWPFYLGEHSKPVTRMLHFVGTSLALVDVVCAIALKDARFLLLAPVSAYGCAWVSHFFLEKNRPATFTYPLWSLRGDFRMYRLTCLGRMDSEIRRAHERFPAGA